MNDIILRKIKKEDNVAVAKIIRQTLTEFGADRPGTVFFDPTTDALFELFNKDRSNYIVAEKNGEIIGGGGIYPTPGLPRDTCELVKMYLLPSARGQGLGKEIIENSLQFAVSAGYKNVYLETMPELKKALSVYEKAGFTYLNAPMGESGHFGCALWMLKTL